MNRLTLRFFFPAGSAILTGLLLLLLMLGGAPPARAAASSPPVITSFTASPASVAVNGVSTLTWQASGGTSASVSSIGPVAVGNAIAVQPPSTRTYTLTVSNEAGSTTRTVTVTVTGDRFATAPTDIGPFLFNATRLALADLDRDGRDDLIMTGQAETSPFFAVVNWYPGLGSTAGFGPARQILSSGLSIHLLGQPYDMDRDGDLDPIIGRTETFWHPNSGTATPTFGTARSILPATINRRPFLADFNADGRLDAVGEVSSTLRIAFGTAAGTFGTPVLIDALGTAIEFIPLTIVDFDGDGDMDIAGGKDFAGDAWWYQNSGTGTFTRRPVASGLARLKDIAAADTDGDGDQDLILLVNDSRLGIKVNPGNGISSDPLIIPAHGFTDAIQDFDLADFDLDGDLDIVAIGYTASSFLENTGGNVFTRRQLMDVDDFREQNDLAVGDIDQDGDLDLVMADSRRDHAVWYQNLYKRRAAPQAANANSSPSLVLNEDFGESRLSLSSLVTDADSPANELTYSIISTTGSELLAGIAVDPATRELVLRSAADLNGSASVTLRATDAQGLFVQLLLGITITPQPDAPRPATAIPTLTAAADAAPIDFEVAPLFSDPDAGDILRFTLTGNSNPAITGPLTLDPVTGRLHITFAPYVSGTTTLQITATDSTDRSASLALPVVLPDLPPPTLSQQGAPLLNRLTGLFEQTLVITNGGARDLGGFTLTVSGLPAGVTLWNASAGPGVVSYLIPIPVGASVSIVLEYYSASRNSSFVPVITLVPALPAAAPPSAGTGAAVDRCEVLPDGSLLIEFSSRPGARYQIEYSDDSRTWKKSPAPITAAGNRVQWIDRGPPRTDSPPVSKSSRFYRVLDLTPP